MIIEHKINGIEIRDIIDGYMVKQFYIGYTLKEAKRMFRQFIKGGNK